MRTHRVVVLPGIHRALLGGFLWLLALAPAPSQQNTPEEKTSPLPPGAIARLGSDKFWHGAAIQVLAFSPDEKTLYVAVSDPKRPVVMAYNLAADGTVWNGRVFFDAAPLMNSGKGLPDGLKTDKLGNVWTTGPGGVLIITPEGKHIGTLNTHIE